ncbi:MAG: TraM recognition domain-containing protein [Clostridia bacterium]|nr:TraM recognition domain-containing protein [Clostridia bacterium]
MKVVKILKLVDKLLKKLKTDRNTFFTYILTLITIYLVVDRFVDLLITIFTGIPSSYWNPIQYTLALACPVFAFLFSCSSKFVKSQEMKVSFLYTYIVALYILVMSMFTQWINSAGWLALLSVPHYPKIATEFSYLIKPAFCWTALYLPLITFYPIFKLLYTKINDTPLMLEGIYEYKGINLAPKNPDVGPNTCEIALCTDYRNGKTVKISEKKRFESMLVVGVSGSGKTSLIFEPMIARDIDKKYQYRETSKELAFVSLKTGIASLVCPYDNDYINNNFNLNMIKPKESKIHIFQSYMKKMIYNVSSNNITYRNLGLTYISPDFESTSHILEIAKAYKMHVNLIDPKSPDSPGLNPFAYKDPMQTAVAISTVLKGLYDTSAPDLELAYRENFSSQAIENLAILLKEMYPRMHDGELPTLEDMLSMLNDFQLVEYMCNELSKNPELEKKYAVLLSYFKKNFYSDGIGRRDTEKFIYSASSQLDTLLRYPGIRDVLCNRSNNIDFDNMLENGDVTLLCTRRGDLGASAHKAFGLFFILSMQYAVLRRPGNENTRIPHFLYIDEFADFICPPIETIFTMYRKYRVGTVISVQNLDQLNVQKKRYRNTIIANCASKVVFGNNLPEDNDWWSKELGQDKKWRMTYSYDLEKDKYDAKAGNVSFKPDIKFQPGKIQSLKFKQCIYKIAGESGKYENGTGILNFVDAKYKEKHDVKKFNFTKYASGEEITTSEGSGIFKKKKPVLNSFSEDDNNELELDPIRTDYTDSIFEKETEEAIIKNNVNNN